MAIVVALLSVLVDTYIYFEIRKASGRRSFWSRLYAATSVLLWIFLLIVLLMPRRDPSQDITPVMWMLFSYMSVYVAKILYAVMSLIGKIPLLWKGKAIPTGFYVGIPVAVFAFLSMWWGALVTTKEIEINEVTIVSPALPEAFDNYRIVQFSDAHVGTWGNDTTFVSQLVDTINSLHPDLIVFTGDVVNRNSQEINPFITVLSRLRAKDGVYSIMGNHDYGDYTDWDNETDHLADRERMRAIQKQMGWLLLDNEHVFLRRDNDSIVLIGVENWGEPPFHQYGDLAKAYPFSPDSVNNINDSNFKILLSHNPEHWRREVSRISNIDLTLSGHTHAMQIMFSAGPFKWSPSALRYQEWGGLYKRANDSGRDVRIYVNIGCGEVGMPARIGATPEITVITLTRAGTPTKATVVEQDNDTTSFLKTRRRPAAGRK